MHIAVDRLGVLNLQVLIFQFFFSNSLPDLGCGDLLRDLIPLLVGQLLLQIPIIRTPLVSCYRRTQGCTCI